MRPLEGGSWAAGVVAERRAAGEQSWPQEWDQLPENYNSECSVKTGQ